MVGGEHQLRLAGLWVAVADAPQVFGVVLRRVVLAGAARSDVAQY